MGLDGVLLVDEPHGLQGDLDGGVVAGPALELVRDAVAVSGADRAGPVAVPGLGVLGPVGAAPGEEGRGLHGVVQDAAGDQFTMLHQQSLRDVVVVVGASLAFVEAGGGGLDALVERQAELFGGFDQGGGHAVVGVGRVLGDNPVVGGGLQADGTGSDAGVAELDVFPERGTGADAAEAADTTAGGLWQDDADGGIAHATGHSADVQVAVLADTDCETAVLVEKSEAVGEVALSDLKGAFFRARDEAVGRQVTRLGLEVVLLAVEVGLGGADDGGGVHR